CLKKKIESDIQCQTAVGHTRWATHGQVSEVNAHPHISGGFAIVHNGIIENYQEIRKELIAANFKFESETDSEIIAHLLHQNFLQTRDFADAFKTCISCLRGTYAIVAICDSNPNMIIGTKQGSPMTVGLSSNEESFYIASDAVALSSICEELICLKEGDIVICQKCHTPKCNTLEYTILDASGNKVKRNKMKNNISLAAISKAGFEDFMLKEIFEEPCVISRIFDNFNSDFEIAKYKEVSIIACGSSFYAGLLAKYWIEDLVNIHVDVEIASEFRYRKTPLFKDNIYIFISQSGETIDTLEALRKIKAADFETLALVNVENSSIAREADRFININAGIEIGVASTKAFVAQIMTMLLLSVKNLHNIKEVEQAMQTVLDNKNDLKTIANKIKDCKSLFYIGRGPSYPIALEGALKIKEIAYISAEGYPAGEIKHGPIAMIDNEIHTVVIAPMDKYFGKTLSNTQEILARNGRVIFLTTQKTQDHIESQHKNKNVDIIFLPDVEGVCQAFVSISAIHMLAYYTSKIKGFDVDKPRNLAKSVTVE
ncbi:MAG: glutamine--fructose-6-phosphate transaminase (isomerizing), partial [Holosporales bacterium]|nr:glutamine--fructose-6-phosphate transaminase (isomerizing) [Holosporales bacterium]